MGHLIPYLTNEHWSLARHFKNKWIARDQCYGCHISYGATGTIEGKRDGFRHWLYYVTGTYSDPIKFVGSYSNSNCLYCHEGTRIWERNTTNDEIHPATLSTTATVMEGTKRVEACASCHVMGPFVNDLKNPASPTLAARHFKNKWIARDQCYGCHISYGATGTIEGKRDGFRHWLYYVTGTYSDPIKFVGSYSNSNCLYCHEGTRIWERIKSHNALRTDLEQDLIACIRCHGPPHPLPHERTLVSCATF